MIQAMVKAMTCINDQCNRAGIQVFGNGRKCKDCGEIMVPYSDFHEPDELEDMEGVVHVHRQKLPSRVVVTHAANNTFTCPPDLSGCPIAQKSKVLVPMRLYQQWVYLAGQISTEWIAYLTGKVLETGEILIEDMYFPRQKATPTHVEAEDGGILPNTVAAVHSHVGMNVFFSAEDTAHMNHLVEMVVNNRGDILANGRTKLECGRFHRGPAAIEFIQCDTEMRLEDQLRSVLQRDTTRFKTEKVEVVTEVIAE